MAGVVPANSLVLLCPWVARGCCTLQNHSLAFSEEGALQLLLA